MPIIDFLSDSMYVLTGSSVSFRCHASGIPKPNIFWYFIGVSTVKEKYFLENKENNYID